MLKRMLAMVMLLILILSFVGCDEGLIAYKTSAKTELDSYAEELGQDSYSAENWSIIQNKVTESKTSIDKAGHKTDVDSLTASAKAEIDEISPKVGDVYRLSGDLQKKLSRIT